MSRETLMTHPTTPPFAARSEGEILLLPSPEALRERILAERPELAPAISRQDFVRATDEIREFASHTLLWHPEGHTSLPDVDPLRDSLEATQLLYFFDTGEIAVEAGGACSFLAELYRLFGFVAGWYRVGLPEVADHAFTLVAVPAGSGVEIHVHDPVFCGSLETCTEGSRDLRDLLHALTANGGHEIQLTIRTNDVRPPLTGRFEATAHPDPGLAHVRTMGVVAGPAVQAQSYLTGSRCALLPCSPGPSGAGFPSWREAVVRRMVGVLDCPADRCDWPDLLRFALTLPQSGDKEMDRRVQPLLRAARRALQREIDPGNLRFPLEAIREPEPRTLPPEPPGGNWVRYRGCYFIPREAFPEDLLDGTVEITAEIRAEYGFHDDAIPAGDLELPATLHALTQAPGEPFYMLELGAGFGVQCMLAASYVQLEGLPDGPSSLHVAAIDAEPNHYRWTRETLLAQEIDAQVHFGAITDSNGMARFMMHKPPNISYGQALKPKGNFAVPTYSLERYLEMTGFPHVHLLHLDVQGSEVDVLRAAHRSRVAGRIDYILVGTHSEAIEEELREILAPTHELLIEVPIKREIHIPSLGVHVAAPVDGFQFYRRWGLHPAD